MSDEEIDVAPPRTTLFTTRERVPVYELPWATSLYDRLDLSSSPQHVLTRARMDAWFAEVAQEHRASIKGEFINKNPAKHLSGFFELYLHEWLLRLDEPFQAHIASDGSGTLPDFSAGARSRQTWIEAVVAAGDSVIEHRTRANQLYDVIERRSRQPGFLLDIAIKTVGGPDSPGRAIVADIDGWLRQFNPDNLPEPPPKRDFTFPDGWHFCIRANRRRPEARGHGAVIGTKWEGHQEHTIVGNDRTITFEGPKRIDEVQPLLTTLERKADQAYAVSTDAFVIAVLAAGDFADERDLVQALYGRDTQAGFGAPVRQADGLWIASDGTPRNSHVSAVAAAFGLSPDAVEFVEPVVYVNPWASHPLPDELLPWRTVRVAADGQMEEQPARIAASTLLDLRG